MPIDPNFKKNLTIKDNHNGHAVWGEIEPPNKLGIHGTNVAVDLDICYGCLRCINVCTVNVFVKYPTPGNPVSKLKVDPINENDCFFCLACEMVCPVDAILIERKSSGDTLSSLLDY
ncbi:MAG: 4Fe-4S dicluster domain-containing protein [Candidatus Helarchaeota archaeon]